MKQWARDLFLGTLALVVLYDQVFVAAKAQPILIFLVIFLFGCIPALRGDRKQEGEYGPFVRIIMSLLGVKLPQNFQEGTESDQVSGPESEGHGGGGSHSGTHAQAPGGTSASGPGSSSK